MKRSDLSPPPQQKRAKGFNFDFGSIAFSDPMLLIGKAAKARDKARETWNDTGKKTRAKKSERSDYHRKHG